MKILIIGGTKFSGRHIVSAAAANGHDVTVFHRGNHPIGDLEASEEILGNRIFDLEKLENRSWDAAIDMCGYLPQWVEDSTSAFKNSVDKYVFISSISAYSNEVNPNYTEDADLELLTPEQKSRFAEIDPNGDFGAADLGDMYGALKVLCEEAVLRAFPDRNLIIRPGLIVGEYDWTDRWTYWVMRVAKGSEVLAPGKPESPAQFIDAKDLAEWIIHLIESDETGTFNAVNRPFELTFEEMLSEIRDVSASDASFTWVSEQFMDENKVAPWSDMPLHVPQELEFLHSANVDAALAKGLKIRDLKETIADTLKWRVTIPEEMKAGISIEREKELLTKWHEQNPD
ncbi:MAG: NAD-dependent dehydratase [Pyrinomonadaceae bacterium]|nr:NAD-dependent dehydratase [Pyrinomonadaceae bacterium]